MLQLHNRWKNSAFKAEPNFNLKVSIKHQIQASVDVGLHLNLGKDPATKSDEFLEGGGHFQSKNLYCRFWEL